jgi:hypothetical protein
VPGLTVFEAVEGFGDRGGRTGGELTDALVNHCLLTTCRTEQLDELAATLEPVLRRYGGLCLISDALVIRGRPGVSGLGRTRASAARPPLRCPALGEAILAGEHVSGRRALPGARPARI